MKGVPNLSTRRLVGRIVAPARGPTVIFTGALHGNEPAGVHALRRVFAALHAADAALHGEVIGFTGNRRALRAGQRYLQVDLNRVWTPAYLTDGSGVEHDGERGELRELHAAILGAFQRRRGPVYHVDLHTTSGDSPPFTTIADTLHNRRFALHFPVPAILGLEEHLDGTLLTHTGNLGAVTMGFEGGRHDDPASLDRIEACIWLALVASGALPAAARAEEVTRARDCLRHAARGLPRVLEVRHRHPVHPNDGFRMAPGYTGFAPVHKGEALATDIGGPVRTPQGGRVLMPLYQTQGDDGFFVMREFKRFWLGVSAALRRLRLDALLPILPGVRRVPDAPGTLVIRRRVARWYAKEIFHLLGYRREREEGDVLVMSRRREAIQPVVAASRSSARRASAT